MENLKQKRRNDLEQKKEMWKVYSDGPREWKIGLQEMGSPIGEAMVKFSKELMVILAIIGVSIGILLGFIIWKYGIKSKSAQLGEEMDQRSFSRTEETVDEDEYESYKEKDNKWLETIWTIVPILILIWIAIPTFTLIYTMGAHIIEEEPGMTIKVEGRQWYWTYEYEKEGIEFDSYMKPEEELELGELRLLEVDNRLVVPVDTTIRLWITASDVIHSWAVPGLGIKMDAIPGRMNQVLMYIKKVGTYYGQCSELCGMQHGFMPIVVEAVALEKYIEWVSKMKEII